MDPYIGEIRIFAGIFAPVDWYLCNGQSLAVQEYAALFSVIGTQYGGDGVKTFMLPNLQGMVPIGMGSGPNLSPRQLGQSGGAASVTLTLSQLASHNHGVNCQAALTQSVADSSSVWANGAGSGRGAAQLYASSALDTTMNEATVKVAGGNLPHNNLQPSLSVNFIICYNGIYPPKPS
jgi:microcystin-dependent protein